MEISTSIELALWERLENAVKHKCNRTARARIRDIAIYREKHKNINRYITEHELMQKFFA